MASPERLIHAVDDELSVQELEEKLEELDTKARAEQDPDEATDRPSIYVQTIEEMINAVWEHEYHLLSEGEWDIFSAFANLPYRSRFTLTRIALRRPNLWHTLAGLATLKKEVGEELVTAIDELCRPIMDTVLNIKEEDVKIDMKEEEREIIDLTLDSDDEDGPMPAIVPICPENVIQDVNPEAGPSKPLSIPDIEDSTDLDLSFFCQNECSMSLPEILWRLSVDQLKSLAKEMKVSVVRQNKPTLISALLRNASTQTTLNFVPNGNEKGKGKGRDDGLRQTMLAFPVFTKSKGSAPPVQTQEEILRGLALKRLEKCVRMNADFYKLLIRMHVIAFRSTELPTSICLPALLTSFKKRSYAKYTYKRDGGIWSSREEVMEYVKALELEASIDGMLDSGTALDSKIGRTSKTPATGDHKFALPATPLRTPRSAPTAKIAAMPRMVKSEEDIAELEADGARGEVVAEEVKESQKDQKERMIKHVFEEVVYPKWKTLVTAKEGKAEREVRRAGLERFESGSVLTRIIHRMSHSLGGLKEYRLELEVLEALLRQRWWRRRKRARWYERRAVLLTRYLCSGGGGSKREDVLKEAMRGVIEALEDEDTGIVYRPSLVRRLVRLEKQLDIPMEERCKCEGELRKADVVFVEAVRVWIPMASTIVDSNGRPVTGRKGKENNRATTPMKSDEARAYFTPMSAKIKDAGCALETPHTESSKVNKSETGSHTWKSKGKSVWLGTDGEEVNVETRALQYYEGLGYKGFHSETRILTTLFALLFWDIIFADVPGAFETPYQSAPLDMAEEAFYYARKELIEIRLKEIKGGWAEEILQKHDTKYREKGTWCIGVRWDICESTDLLEIVECLGGESLAIVCRLFCEDYAGRSSGVPDLVVWNAAESICKFVEVKGPGDTPQENQKLWMDSLLGAGTPVEVCKVVEVDQETDKKGKRRAKRQTKTPNTDTVKRKKRGKERIEMVLVDSDLEPGLENGDPKFKQLTDDDLWLPPTELTGEPMLIIEVEPETENHWRGTKRHAPDEHELPVFRPTLPTSTPISTPNKLIANRAEVVITTPTKKRRLQGHPSSSLLLTS